MQFVKINDGRYINMDRIAQAATEVSVTTGITQLRLYTVAGFTEPFTDEDAATLIDWLEANSEKHTARIGCCTCDAQGPAGFDHSQSLIKGKHAGWVYDYQFDGNLCPTCAAKPREELARTFTL